MGFANSSLRSAPTPGASRQKARQDRFDSPIGTLTPGQKAIWDGMSESERELTKYLFHVPDADLSKIDLLEKAGPRRPTGAERRNGNGRSRFQTLEEAEGTTETVLDEAGGAENDDGSADYETKRHRKREGRADGPPEVKKTEAHTGSGASFDSVRSGTEEAYRDLLLKQARKDPKLYSNPIFVRELQNAEQRAKETETFTVPSADSYSPARSWREAVGGAARSLQNGINAMSTFGRDIQSGQYASAAMDQRFLGKLTGKEDYYDRADSLIGLSRDAADRAAEPAVDFADRYEAETARLYPYTGRAQGFLNRVIRGTSSMLPSIVGNLIAPGSGLYINMLQSVGGAMAEARNRGADDSTARAYGVTVGIADTMLEKLVDGLGGVFGKGALDRMIGEDIRRMAVSSAAQESLIYLGGMLGEGFEEFLSVFTTELLDVHMLGTTAQTWEALLEEGGLSFFSAALVSGLVQGASRLGQLVDAGADEITIEDLAKQMAEEVEAKLRENPAEPEPSDALREAEPWVAQTDMDTETEPEPEADRQNSAKPVIDSEADSGYNKAHWKQRQIIANGVQGKIFENKMYPQFEAEYYFTERQITIVMPSGTRIRVDAIGLDVDGNVVIMEYKSSATAQLTKNQKLAFEEFREKGGFVVDKGKGFFYGGTDIPPIPSGSKILIQRPGQLEVW